MVDFCKLHNVSFTKAGVVSENKKTVSLITNLGVFIDSVSYPYKDRWIYTYPQRDGYSFCSRTYFNLEEIQRVVAKEEIRIGIKCRIIKQTDDEPTY